ncbi:unnamed protein product, partial [Phaeothamnion confervicola]
ITAVAIAENGRKIEIYAGTNVHVLVDGALTTIAPGDTIETGSLSVTATADAFQLSASGLNIVVDVWSGGPLTFLDVTVTVDSSAPIQGFLGSPNGNANDDFTGSDGGVLR